MSKPLTSSQLRLYSKLWKKFKTKGFNFKQAQSVLRLARIHVRVTLHRIREKGWLKTERRRNISRYVLISPDKAISEIK